MAKQARPSRVIWTSDIGQLSDWADYLEEEGLTGLSTERQYAAVLELNNSYLGDERVNLNKQIKTGIVAFVDCSLWNGKQLHVLNVGYNLGCCLDTSTTGVLDGSWRWFVDRYGNLRCDAAHHDGTNHVVYRMWKPQMSAGKQLRCATEMRVAGCYNSTIAGRYTQSLGSFVNEIYGW